MGLCLDQYPFTIHWAKQSFAGNLRSQAGAWEREGIAVIIATALTWFNESLQVNFSALIDLS